MEYAIPTDEEVTLSEFHSSRMGTRHPYELVAGLEGIPVAHTPYSVLQSESDDGGKEVLSSVTKQGYPTTVCDCVA